MTPLELVRLGPLMERTRGRTGVSIGLIDGPVVVDHPELRREHVRQIGEHGSAACARPGSMACLHGTFIAGILSAVRGASAPAICPDCTLLIRPIFSEASRDPEQAPSATPQELAAAVVECIVAGAHCINLSLALAGSSSRGDRELKQVLDHAAKLGVIVVAAAGNQGTLGSTAITGHPWVIPVAACDLRGRPIRSSTLGDSVGRRGLCAPGNGIQSLGVGGTPLSLRGTSAAAPFVTGTIGLLWSIFPSASASELKFAVSHPGHGRRRSVAPPVLDGWSAHQYLRARC